MKTKAHQIYKLADGSRVIGVTTVTGILNKPELVPWSNKLGLDGIEVGRFVDDKADIGTLAHAMVVDSMQGKTTDTKDYSANQIEQANWACDSFFNWQKKHDIVLIWAELPLVSETYQFGGQPDIYALVDGSVELIDLKTGNAIYKEHKIQVAGGYKILLDENNYGTIGQVRILNIPRTKNEHWGEVIIKLEQCKIFEETFLACLKVYKLLREINNDVVYPKKHKEKKNERLDLQMQSVQSGV